MDTTTTRSTPPADGNRAPSVGTPGLPEPEGTVWVDFGDGGGARWAGLSPTTLDQICAHLETIKPADTLT